MCSDVFFCVLVDMMSHNGGVYHWYPDPEGYSGKYITSIQTKMMYTFAARYRAKKGPNDSLSFNRKIRARPESQCGLPSADLQNASKQSTSGSSCGMILRVAPQPVPRLQSLLQFCWITPTLSLSGSDAPSYAVRIVFGHDESRYEATERKIESSVRTGSRSEPDKIKLNNIFFG